MLRLFVPSYQQCLDLTWCWWNRVSTTNDT